METEPKGEASDNIKRDRERASHKTRDTGPLHTQAKSRDHEIVRAQKKVS
jgi:hypothetical protein